MMLILIWTIVVLVLFYQWYINNINNFWKKKGVPYPVPLPFVGNMGISLLMLKHQGVIFKEMYNNFKDCAYFGYYHLTQPYMVLRSVELIKEITIKEFSSFEDNDVDMDENIDPLFGKNPFVLKGNRWRTVRGKVSSAITNAKIKQMFASICNVSMEMADYLKKEPAASNQDGIDAKELATKFTADIIASCTFGLDGRSFKDPQSEFRMMGKQIFTETIERIWIFLFPSIAAFLKFSLISSEVRQWFTNTIKQTIKYREDNNVVRNDYLDSMIAFKSKQDDDYVFTDMDVMGQLVVFFSDALETTATTLSFALYELAKNQDVQEKLRQEVDEVLAKYNGEITYEAIHEMEYLDMVILETLRLRPTAMFLRKRCTKQFTFPPAKGTGPGVVIDPGMSIIVPVYGIHCDPQYYSHPDQFYPEHFTKEAKDERPKCAYIPFGEGPRKCLGFRFAIVQMKAALSAIISNFDIKINPKTSPTMKITSMCFFMNKKGGIWLNFCQRK